jgi:bifunctional N-acetylglucosamine-1-phosphate-uridyltransferase/glucosamine-1-phosphate-acetyltransferase GlmU-like protein
MLVRANLTDLNDSDLSSMSNVSSWSTSECDTTISSVAVVSRLPPVAAGEMSRPAMIAAGSVVTGDVPAGALWKRDGAVRLYIDEDRRVALRMRFAS